MHPVVYPSHFLCVDTDDLGSQTSRSVGAGRSSEVHVKREPSYDDFIMDDDMGTYVTCCVWCNSVRWDFIAVVSEHPARYPDSFAYLLVTPFCSVTVTCVV
jgi:hypothetical protein